MREGDGFAFYSPRVEHLYGAPLQAFTAIGRVGGGAIFQADEGDGFVAFRRAVDYLSAHEAPIKPLLEALSFIRNKAYWGAAFRFGFIKVPEVDFALIAAAMGREFARDFPPSDSGVPASPRRITGLLPPMGCGRIAEAPRWRRLICRQPWPAPWRAILATTTDGGGRLRYDAQHRVRRTIL